MSLRSRVDESVVRRRWVVGVLVAGIAIVAIEAWFPTTSRVSRDEPVVADGIALFEGHSILESTPGPEWLGDAIDAGSLEVRLSFETAGGDQDGPARLLTITEDVHHADLMIGQDDADLVLRVRRPSSDASGEPAFVVPGAFSEGWHELSVRIAAGRLEATFDGQVVLDEPLAAGTDGTGVSSWDRNYRVALGDEPDGDREWEGRLRDVAFVTTSGSTDLLAPGVLQPQTGTIEITRERMIQRPPDESAPMVVLRLILFVPAGIALGFLLRRPLVAASIGLALPLALAFGKRFASGRHPGAAEVIVGTIGVWAGIVVARIATRTRSDLAERGASS
jgi:hypothetical protein